MKQYLINFVTPDTPDTMLERVLYNKISLGETPFDTPYFFSWTIDDIVYTGKYIVYELDEFTIEVSYQYYSEYLDKRIGE